MSEQESPHFYFPKWMNKTPLIVLFVLLGIMSIVVFVFTYWFTPKNFEVGYMPEQPIPFSHRLHAGELGLDCRYCHIQVESGPQATVPPTQTCMNCHTQIKTNSPHIQKIKESFDTDKPLEWVKVHYLPDYVYFDHSRHVNSGVSCVTCHGRVDKMDRVRQVESLSMSWCLECHRDPAKNIRPKDKVTQLDWVADNALKTGQDLVRKYHIKPREDCSTCHR